MQNNDGLMIILNDTVTVNKKENISLYCTTNDWQQALELIHRHIVNSLTLTTVTFYKLSMDCRQ